jgi:radical SAM superfamily enzyme YgiQ (UPF0313 family)
VKILLIKPRWFVKGGVYRFLETIRFAPLNLCILGALSGKHEVKIVDLDWQAMPDTCDFDLVGITVATFTSEQAYAIGDTFRKRGVKVVMGGVHPSLLPEECLLHADSVVIGEAEYAWPELLNDLHTRHQLKPIYKSDRVTDLDDVPVLRKDNIDADGRIGFLEATRGCTNKCKFCYLTSVPWGKYRKKKVDAVIREIESMKEKIVFFVDDNLFVDEDYVLELMKRLKPLKKLWSVQAPLNIVRNERLIRIMSEAGCFNLQLGFQTINKESLDWAGIRHSKIEEYKEIVKQLHRQRILVTAFIIFGFDTDDPGIFKRTTDFIIDSDIDEAHLYILTPYPGTALFEQFKREGRLLAGKTRKSFGWANATFIPKQMSPEQLEEGVESCYRMLHPHFRKVLIRKLFKRLPILLRSPELIRILISGSIRKPSLGNY